MKRTLVGCILASVVLVAPRPALADLTCISGPLSGFLGTTCDIGNEAFHFASIIGTGITTAQVELTVDASSPLAPVFYCLDSIGPITLSTTNSMLDAQINFTVSTVSGNPTPLGTTVALKSPTAGGTGSNIVDAFDFIANIGDFATVGHPGELPGQRGK